MTTSAAAIGLVLLVAPAPATAAGAESACALLSEEDVRRVQGEPVQERKPSEAGRTFRVIQCFYRTPTFAKSVSVALAVPLPTDAARSGPRDYWRATFDDSAEPRPVPALGDEAFWVGDRVTGALYVLRGDAFLRLSVGGVADEAARLERARVLAESVLPRLARRTGP
jgi:hypothetical protein